MPSVEMRRSTRVFVPKAKDGELVRVLRSGRRLWIDSSITPDKIKHQRTNHSVKNDEIDDDVEWFPIISNHDSFKSPPSITDKHGESAYKDVNVLHREENPKHESKPELMDVDEDEEKAKVVQEVEIAGRKLEEVCKSGSRVIKNVYSRKRKRSNGISDGNRGGKKFGLHFVRRKRRRSGDSLVGKEIVEDFEGGNDLLSIVIESNFDGCSLFNSLMVSVLSQLGSRSVGLEQFSTLLGSNQISSVFSSFGIQYFWNRPCRRKRGVWRIFGERDWMPLFTVDFSAAPLCFLEVHTALFLRSSRLSFVCWLNLHEKDESFNDYERFGHLSRCCDVTVMEIDCQSEHVVSSVSAPERDDSKGKIVVAALEANKVGSSTIRNVQHRSGVLTRSASKRRRRSLRNRRARNPSHFVMQKANVPPVSNNVAFKKLGARLSAGPDQELRRSARKNAASVTNVPKSSVSSVHMSVDVESQQCSVNLLVVETDKCYRVEGAEVVLDLSASNEWVLVVRKDGQTQQSLKVQKELRPNTTNRVTHAVIWAAENGWKLEFPSRKDWIVFKELYKLCSERNVVPASPVVKFIPIPEVSEVANFGDLTSAPFERPESYIRMAGDELSRILLRRAANYDMDSEDEEWLTKFNSGLEEASQLSDETFELMIDAFEKTSYCSPDDVSDEKAAASVCLDLVSPETVEPVYRHWLKRRKQKRAPMLRVFELNEPQRTQVIAKPVLRKKRSLKRTTSYLPMQRGRGKDSNVLQALAAEQTVAEEQSALLKLQEARASIAKLVEVATQKRQRAQFLMENADLAVYRATMALRIAEAASQVDTKQAAAHFLD